MKKYLLTVIANFFAWILANFLGVKSINVFGSFSYKKIPNDIDLVVDSSNYQSILARLIKKIASYFRVDINYLVDNKIYYFNQGKYYNFQPVNVKSIYKLSRMNKL